jgi:SAM-dependent methyltransferase
MTNIEDVQKQITILNNLQKWNHNFILPGGIETRPGTQNSHGKNLVKLKRLQPHFDIIDLNDKNVLDVGCNEGLFSFFMASLGARVLGVDIDTLRIQKASYVKSLLADNSSVHFKNIDIYSQAFRELPQFDLCLCLGFIHRVPDPYTAIKILSEHSNMIIFEWKALKFGPHHEPFAYFSPKEVDGVDYYGTEYWLLSYAALESILRRLKFRYFHRIDDPSQRRAILIAGKYQHAVFQRPDVIVHAGRLKSTLRHTKRFFKSLVGILVGRINA